MSGASGNPLEAVEPPRPRRSVGGAILVGIGIFTNKLFGLARQTVTAKYLGGKGSPVADAWIAAFRIPNMLWNLLGEGVLSGSFIPVYAGLLKQGDTQEADRVAGAVAAFLGLISSVVVLVGIALARPLVWVIASGFDPARRELAVTLTRILFPGAGLFVMAAWCLGVLNAHRRFLLSYLAPALWNAAMIVTFLWYGPRVELAPLAVAVAWGSVIGAGLQFLVQVPAVLSLTHHLRFSLDYRRESVRTVLRNFWPIVVSRGVVQISALVDLQMASWLPEGMASVLGTMQTLYMLPVSLFGMSVSAASLPDLSSAAGSEEERFAYFRQRITGGLRSIAFLVVPSAVAFVALGNVMIRVLFEHGRFTATSTRFGWGIVAGSAFGLLASTLGRLYSQGFYALHDTKPPLRYAVARVSLTIGLGLLFAFPVPYWLGLDRAWGAAGLTFSAGIAGWVEFVLLRRGLQARIGYASVPQRFILELWAIALLAAAAALGVEFATPGANKYVSAFLVLGTYGLIYLGGAKLRDVPELNDSLRRFKPRAR